MPASDYEPDIQEQPDTAAEAYEAGYNAAISGRSASATVAEAEQSGAPFGEAELAALTAGFAAGLGDAILYHRDMEANADGRAA